MVQSGQTSWDVIHRELLSGENILWSGQPEGSAIFHKEDAYLIPFSFLWGGFTIFWEAAAAGLVWFNGRSAAPSFFMLWGIPFVLVGQYLIWGRFLYTAWLKKRTFYAVTNRRAIVIQNGWKRQMASAYIDSLPTLIKEASSNGIGTLRFSPSQPVWRGTQQGWGAWNALAVGDTPAFVDIEDVDSVYRLVSDTREKLRSAKTTP